MLIDELVLTCRNLTLVSDQVLELNLVLVTIVREDDSG